MIRRRIGRTAGSSLRSTLRRDYDANNSGKRALVILGIHRLGNAVYYSESMGPFRAFALAILNLCNQFLVFYPLGIEIPFSCKIGPGLRLPKRKAKSIGSSTLSANRTLVY